MATTNYYPKISSAPLPHEEQNELDALDIVIGLSREERSYLLSVWRSDRNRLTSIAKARNPIARSSTKEVCKA